MRGEEEFGKMLDKMLVDPVDILLSPATAGQYLTYSSQMQVFGFNFNHSDCIDFFEMGSILSKVNVGSIPLFQCFRRFDHKIWFIIFISIVILSFISSTKSMSSDNFYEYFWNYFILLFEISLQKFVAKGNQQKVLLGVWLLSTFILVINFNVYLLDTMVVPTPVHKINNLEELADSKLTVIAREDSSLVTFAKYVDSDLAKSIMPRLRVYSDFGEIKSELFNGLKNGSLAYVNQRLVMIFIALTFNDIEKSRRNGEKEIIDLWHISDDNGGLEPYFLFLKNNMDLSMMGQLNHM